MNQKLFKILTLNLMILFGSTIHAQKATKAHKDSLNSLVEQYYELNIIIFEKDSKVADIDRLFELFTKDFVYIHPKYGGEYSRNDLYDGYINNQKKGGYDGSIVKVKIKNKIIGLNALVTERSYIKKQSDDKTEEIDPGMTLFEFRDGKIFKIFEYW